MKIKIEQIHIDQGKRCTPFSCPIAKALKEKYPDKDISVGYGMIYIDDKKIVTSKAAGNFMHDFDTKKPVLPQEIELDYRVEQRKK